VANPMAVAVLFAGGKGAMQLSLDGAIGWGRGNFLIRSRPLFSRHGIVTAIIDAPSDHPRNLHNGFRRSPEHAADIGAVIGHLRRIYRVPVWLVGTSQGTLSVATGNPCHARHYHGFNGIADRVIADLAAWIKAPAP